MKRPAPGQGVPSGQTHPPDEVPPGDTGGNNLPPQEPTLIGNVKIDGDAQVEVDNNLYDYNSNCVQLIRFPGSAQEWMTFNGAPCTSGALPARTRYFSLPVGTNDQLLLVNTPVGKFDRLSSGVHLFDLCTRAYQGRCTLGYDGGMLVRIQ